MAAAAVAMAALWVGLLQGGLLHGGASDHAAHAEKPAPAVNSVADDRFDWPASGVPRGQQVVQFVPGGRFSFDA